MVNSGASVITLVVPCSVFICEFLHYVCNLQIKSGHAWKCIGVRSDMVKFRCSVLVDGICVIVDKSCLPDAFRMDA